MGTTIRRKLIRDRIPEIRVADGREAPETMDFNTMPLQDQLEIVSRKLLEEALEAFHEINNDPVNNADARRELVEEFADIVEIGGFIMALLDIDPQEVEAVRQDKFEKYGGFTKGLVYNADPSDKPGSEAYDFEITRG